jgi:alpha-tubulin suppressor-like RCC1 family protein
MSIFKRFASLLVVAALVASISGVVQGLGGSWESPAGASQPPPSGDGVLFSWGSNWRNALGLPLSLNPPALSTVPVPTHVAQLGYTVRSASAGIGNAVVAANSGDSFGWGYNDEGELGNGTTALTVDFTQVALPRGVSLETVSSGAWHSLGIDSNGQIWAWGEGEAGALGQGNQTDGVTPVPVTLPKVRVFDPPVRAVAVAASNTTSWAVGSNGRLYVWGLNRMGSDPCFPATPSQCSFRPALVPDLDNVVNVEASASDGAVALRDDGMVWRLLGTTTPTPLANGIAFGTQIASGAGASYVIGLDGRVYAWGNGFWGQLGDGTQNVNHDDDLVQVALPAGVHAVGISATATNGYAIGDNGRLYAWGGNSYGQLGIGTTNGPNMCGQYACATTPVQVALPANHVPVGLPSAGQSNGTAYAILQYVAPGSAPTISGTPPSTAGVGSPYSFGFTVTGAPAPSTYVSGGSLPPGVTLSASGTLSGTPTTPGSYGFTVTAGNGTGSVSTAVTIVVQPSISVGSASILEGDSGTRVLKFPVTLSHPSNTPVTVQYTLQGAPSGGTATGAKKAASGVDFLNNGGVAKTLTFATTGTGLTAVQKDIAVTISGDTAVEGIETFTVRLVNPSSGYVLRQSTATGTILHDDVGIGAPTLGIGDAAVVSSSTGATKLNFPVTLSVPAPGSFTVHYVVKADGATYSSTAAGGGDLGGKKSGTLSFASGNTSKTISVPVWPHLAGSGTKTLRVELSAVSSTGIVLFRSVATGTIVG